ncbi:hypothetical protein [Rubneribacter sp.]
MQISMTKSRFAPIVGLAVAAAAALTLSLATTPAYASDVPYNANAKITAKAYDPTYELEAQTINTTIVFGSSVSGVEAGAMESYLQDNITIAGRTIADEGDADTYARDVYNVAINGNTVTFTIGPNTKGMTANYSSEFLVKADAADNATIAAAMGNADSETIVGSGIAVGKVGVTGKTATFEVTDRAQARSMNHILITDNINGNETAIFEGTGTFSNGGITIHSHSFMSQTTADYAAAIVAATVDGNGNPLNPNYTFVDEGNGQFSITKLSAGLAGTIKVYVYDSDYLNRYEKSVGEIYEDEWVEGEDY